MLIAAYVLLAAVLICAWAGSYPWPCRLVRSTVGTADEKAGPAMRWYMGRFVLASQHGRLHIYWDNCSWPTTYRSRRATGPWYRFEWAPYTVVTQMVAGQHDPIQAATDQSTTPDSDPQFPPIHDVLGIQYQRQPPVRRSSGRMEYWWFEVPYWIIVTLVAAPAGWCYRRAARWRALCSPRGEFCRRCGYDLRASSARCPECGTEMGDQR